MTVTAHYHGQKGWIETDPGYFQVDDAWGFPLYMDGECLEVIKKTDASITLHGDYNEENVIFSIPVQQYERDMIENEGGDMDD